LTSKSAVTAKGLKIGQVNNVLLSSDGNVLVEIYLEKSLEVPTDSRFKIKNADLLGNKEVQVELGELNEFLSSGDTTDGIIEPSIFDGETIQIQAKDLLDNLTGKSKQDSILIELKRLNENLEELKEKK